MAAIDCPARRHARRWRTALWSVLVASLVAACGGGSSGGGNGNGGGGGNPPPPVLKPDAYRFLNQATFGATEAEAQRLMSLGDSTQAYARWIDEQLAQPASLQLPPVYAAFLELPNPAGMLFTLHNDRQEAWLRYAVTAPDQLRQRVAFALSQVFVVSQQSELQNMPFAAADFYDLLARSAFGDFRTLLTDVTLHPAMGVYLNMLGNQKPSADGTIRPDENYARELMQLFTVGLVQLNADGTPKRDAQDQPLPSYDQSVVEGFAHVFTGWNYSGFGSFAAARPTLENQIRPMQAYPEQHAGGSKKLLQYAGAAKPELPAGQTPQQDLTDALDNIYRHPNVGPFISRQLIQRLTASNPSPAYVARVAAVFADDGSGRRGNLGAVVKAILLDAEARPAVPTAATGKVKEPLLRLTQMWRAYGARAANGEYNVGYLSGAFGQGPLQSPSVFNFFSPGYAPPGAIADQGLVAPEMQIATEYLNTNTTNILHDLTLYWVSSTPGLPPEAVVMDTTAELALAGNPDALVDRVAEKLLGRPPGATLRAEAKAAVERTPATNAGGRVADALFFVVTSPEFAVQR